MNKEELGTALSRNVKYTREQLQLSQTAYAEKVGLSRPNLATIEEGRSMSIESVYKISRFLNISIDTLLTTDVETGQSLEKVTDRTYNPSDVAFYWNGEREKYLPKPLNP